MLRVDEMTVNWGASPFEKRRAMIEVRRGLVGRGTGTTAGVGARAGALEIESPLPPVIVNPGPMTYWAR